MMRTSHFLEKKKSLGSEKATAELHKYFAGWILWKELHEEVKIKTGIWRKTFFFIFHIHNWELLSTIPII